VPNEAPVERRLAAILAGDSRTVGVDEVGKLRPETECGQLSSSNSAFASLRSGVLKPSVNQP
jgi:hypothetical protein